MVRSTRPRSENSRIPGQPGTPGLGAFGVVPLLGKGAKWIQTTIAPADAQYLEGRAFQREEIVGLYAPGLPHHLLGWKSNASNFGTGIEAQGIHLVQFVLMDRLLAFEGMINDTLLPEELAFKFNVDGLLRGDSKQRTERMTRMRQWGVLSADDWLEFEDQAPRGIPDDYLSPKNVERLDADSGAALGAAAGPPPPGPPQAPPAPPQQPQPPVQGRRPRTCTATLTEARCTNPDCTSTQGARRGALMATNVGTATLKCPHCKVRTRVRDGYALRDETDALDCASSRNWTTAAPSFPRSTAGSPHGAGPRTRGVAFGSCSGQPRRFSGWDRRAYGAILSALVRGRCRARAW